MRAQKLSVVERMVDPCRQTVASVISVGWVSWVSWRPVPG